MDESSHETLLAEHTDRAIASRLDTHQSHGDLGDVVLGAVDGTITTFAIVSGIAGTGSCSLVVFYGDVATDRVILHHIVLSGVATKCGVVGAVSRAQAASRS